MGVRPTHSVAPLPAPAAPTSPNTIIDPLTPDRPATRDSSVRPAGPGSWVTARPGFQFSRPPSERGGVNPCSMPEVDTSAFGPWSSLSKGRFSAPRDRVLDASGRFDLVIHLHGDDLARRELVLSHQPFGLYSL